MPEDTGITIPRKKDKEELSTLQKLLKWQQENDENMTESQKATTETLIEILRLEEEKQEVQKPIWKGLMTTLLHPAQKKFMTLKNKLTEKYHKVFVKEQFFKKMGQTLKTIAEKTGSFIWTLIKALMVLALFDPNGKFLTNTLIPFLLKAVKFVIDKITTLLPPLIKAMINIVFNVLPPALIKLFSGILSSLFTMFDTWMKEFPKDSIMFKILGFIRDIFAKDSALMQFLTTLAKIAPYILLAVGAMKAYTLAITIFNSVIASSLLPIVLLVGALVTLWTWRDKIAGWFESLFEWFSNLNVVFKILIGVLALVFWPVTAFIGLIYGLVKLFQSFANIGVLETFKLIGEYFKNLGVMLLEGFLKIPEMLLDALLFPFKMYWKITKFIIKFIWKGIKKLFNAIDRFFNGVPSFIGNLILRGLKNGLEDLKDLGVYLLDGLKKGFAYLFVELPKKLGEKLMGIFDPIKSFFSSIITWFNTIANVGIWDYFNMNKKEREQATQATKMIEVIEKAKESSISLPKELATFTATATKQGEIDFDKLIDTMKEVGDKQVKVQIENAEKVSERVESFNRSTQSSKFIPQMNNATAKAR